MEQQCSNTLSRMRRAGDALLRKSDAVLRRLLRSALIALITPLCVNGRISLWIHPRFFCHDSGVEEEAAGWIEIGSAISDYESRRKKKHQSITSFQSQ